MDYSHHGTSILAGKSPGRDYITQLRYHRFLFHEVYSLRALSEGHEYTGEI